MEPRSAEQLVLASIKTPEDISYLRVQHNLKKTDFVFFPDVANLIYEQSEQFGKIPDASLIQATLPEYVPIDGTDNFQAAAYELSCVVIDRLATNSIQAFMGSPSGPGPMEKDSPSALPLLRRSLQSIETAYIGVDTTRSKVLDSSTAMDRLEAYKERVKNYDSEGQIRTGFQPLDDFRLYIAPGMVIGLFANTAVGKSWFSLRIAAEMYRQGYKVAVISPELPVDQIEIRSDILLSYMMGYKLSHMGLTLGKAGLEKEYEKYLRDVGDKEDWINMETIVGDKINLTTITDFVVREKPFLLVVDSILQMEDESKSKNSWEQMMAKVQGLHDLAMEKKMVILVTNQATRRSSEYFGPANLGDVAYGYDFARYVDILISFGEVENVADRRQVTLRKVRTGVRNAEPFEFLFDPDTGDIGRTAVDTDSEKGTYESRVTSLQSGSGIDGGAGGDNSY